MAREHARRLIDGGHDAYYIHPQIGEGVPGATNVDVELHTHVVPVHEYLPSASANQKAVSVMGYEEAMAYLPAYEGALETAMPDVDMIIGHHANISAIATANVARRHNKPYILFLHGTGIEPRHTGGYDDKVWQQIKEAVEKASGIIVTTDYVRDSLVRPLVDIPLDRFLVLPCGVDVDEFHPQNVRGVASKYELPERYVICPGALMLAKGPQNVVTASEQYADLAQTIFIGGGELRDELEAKLGDRGRFLGFVSTEDKAKLINAATILTAAPEKKEHFGIIYAEALGGGTPVVAYDGGGVPSIVTSEVGILTDRDPRSLGKAIGNLLEGADPLAEMGTAARQRAQDTYSYDVLIPRLEQWLEDLVYHNR